ncbi:MAG: hypothetical protein QOI12_2781 [Alphaproteobacteria bacterium]|jgi:glycosyltransferase involved in cell wall biosynthesis|nr:hypothetical protein [Alphaproteobacteria bacterium]
MLDNSTRDSYRSRDELSVDCALLEESEIFDADAYSAATGIDPASAAKHYLAEGWLQGHEPCPGFEGRFLYPYYRSVGFSGCPAMTYLTLRAAGWPVFPNRAAVEHLAEFIRSNNLFDAAAYRARLDGSDLDPLFHYIVVGERMGHAPSAGFDAAYYGERHLDVAQSGMSYLQHYVTSGRSEGRPCVSLASQLEFDRTRLRPDRKTVLLVSHQASRTGAPILAYNIAMHLGQRCNVVALLLTGGDLVYAFEACCAAVIGPLPSQDLHPVDAEYLVRRILATYDVSFAIVNSIESRSILRPLAFALVPTVTLVHEFPAHLGEKGEMGRSLEWATQSVFSSSTVLSLLRAEYPNIDNWPVHVLPQGQSALPSPAHAHEQDGEQQSTRKAMRPEGFEDATVVLGCGTIFFRKGIDLFVSCAAATAAIRTKKPVRFVWIGKRLDEEDDGGYFDHISNLIAAAGVADRVAILDEVVDLEPAYASADVFFLSSRRDALPNVAIDSALRGLPVISFADSGGVSEIFGAAPETAMSVVPGPDVEAAARLIAKLADDEALRRDLGDATRRIAAATFDMGRYVRQIEHLGDEAREIMRQRGEDFETIRRDSMFDMIGFLGREGMETTRDEAIRLFLGRAAALGTSRIPTANFYYRRPCAGFHPQIYAEKNADRYDTAKINPLAHFIRSGKPEGPWYHQVLRPPKFDEITASAPNLRIGLHAHFHYPELAAGLLAKLLANRARCDLLLTTSTPVKAETLRAATAGYEAGSVTIRVVPNRGRDIGPFLTAFDDAIEDYEIVGHVHSKRSLFAGGLLGESWRDFLWQNLIGDLFPMLDIIIGHFEADKTLGLVFPEDFHLPDWDKNRAMAERLARRMGIQASLPAFFDFPVGTMFWARAKALQPLFDLKLGWNDYPEEPLPIDGTLLHALERLVPFAAQHAGYRFATTHLPGVTW